jgi:hypothetical protein
MNKKRNLILLHENQTRLLITFKHDGSESKEESRKIIDICREEKSNRWMIFAKKCYSGKMLMMSN